MEQPQNLGIWGSILWFAFNFLFNVGIVGALYAWSQGHDFISDMRGHLQTEKGGFNILGPFIIAGKGGYELFDLFMITATLAYWLKFVGEVGTAIGTTVRAVFYAAPFLLPSAAAWFGWENPGGFPTYESLGVVVPAGAMLIGLVVHKMIYLLITRQSMMDDIRRDIKRLPAIAIIFLMYYGRLNILDLGSAFTQFYHNWKLPYL